MILPPAHEHVLIQSVHGEEGLFTDGSIVNVPVREVERGKEWLSESMCRTQLYNETVFLPILHEKKKINMWWSMLILWQAATCKSMYGKHWKLICREIVL